jgi:hypothetical protein
MLHSQVTSATLTAHSVIAAIWRTCSVLPNALLLLLLLSLLLLLLHNTATAL